jgi:hypothetical protein
MNNELYVGRVQAKSFIEVYDVATLTHRRDISIPGLRCVSEMTSCPQCDVVYVNNCFWQIYVIDEHGLRISWSFAERPNGLSINSQLNVVVTFSDSPAVRIFTPTGQVIRNITLQSDILVPKQAIQLDEDRFAVLHSEWSDLHRLCIVNGRGTVIESYGGNEGSDVGQLQSPLRMLSVNGWLIVADSWNFRLLLFNGSPLTYTRELITTPAPEAPLRLAITDDGSQLFVSYWVHDLKTYNLTWA